MWIFSKVIRLLEFGQLQLTKQIMDSFIFNEREFRFVVVFYMVVDLSFSTELYLESDKI